MTMIKAAGCVQMNRHTCSLNNAWVVSISCHTCSAVQLHELLIGTSRGMSRCAVVFGLF